MTTQTSASFTYSGGDESDKGLKGGALGLMSSVVMAVSSTAPAYSLAAALGIVVAAAGLQSALIMVLAFIPMILIAWGYQGLNRAVPDCGTTFTWGVKTFGSYTGWMGGWAVLAADILVMSNLAAISGQYFFSFFGADGLATSTFWQTFAGLVWIVGMTAICYIGIEVSARIQYGLLGIEVVMLMVMSVVALVKVYTHNAPAGSIRPNVSWINPFDISSFRALSLGVLAAVFIYWGWDTAMSVNEETKDKAKTPGRAVMLATLILLGTYFIATIAAEAFAGVGTKGNGLANPDHAGDVLSILGKSVFGTSGVGTVFSHLLILMVMSSAAASTLTTILPTARTSLAMAAYRAIPYKFARIHPRYLTPTWSTVGMGVVSAAVYLVLTGISSNIVNDSIDSVGLMIAFYYGMTGFSCFWYYRKDAGSMPVAEKWRLLVAPFLGGVILLVLFIYAADQYWNPNYGYTVLKLPFWPDWRIGGTFLIGIGSLVIGAVLMVIYRFIAPPFFKGATLNRETAVLVPDTD
jgi:amino acid transporter